MSFHSCQHAFSSRLTALSRDPSMRNRKGCTDFTALFPKRSPPCVVFWKDRRSLRERARSFSRISYRFLSIPSFFDRRYALHGEKRRLPPGSPRRENNVPSNAGLSRTNQNFSSSAESRHPFSIYLTPGNAGIPCSARYSGIFRTLPLF